LLQLAVAAIICYSSANGLTADDSEDFFLLADKDTKSAEKFMQDGRAEDAAYLIHTAWDATRTLQNYAPGWRKDVIKYKMQKIREMAKTCLEKLDVTFATKGVLSNQEARLTKPDDLISSALDSQLRASKAVASMDLVTTALQVRRCAELIGMMRSSQNPQLIAFANMLSRSIDQVYAEVLVP
jgi:hypothetical protein